jgi:enoyl-CoA hydratase/carnithine racemase
MAYEDIIVEAKESWVEITLNHPAKLNALREKTAEELMQALGEAESKREIRAVILQGGEKAFCTGLDTSEIKIEPGKEFDFYRFRKSAFKLPRFMRELAHYTKLVICAVEGYALGGGLEVALLCDMIVAGEKAQFGLPEARLGMVPAGGGTQTLPRLIGKPLAKELKWIGRRITAEEAKSYRLVNHVMQAGKAIEKARELAKAIVDNAPLAVMVSKAAIDRGVDMSLLDGIATEADLSYLLYFSRDREEGLAAFREKRAPTFRGE